MKWFVHTWRSLILGFTFITSVRLGLPVPIARRSFYCLYLGSETRIPEKPARPLVTRASVFVSPVAPILPTVALRIVCRAPDIGPVEFETKMGSHFLQQIDQQIFFPGPPQL